MISRYYILFLIRKDYNTAVTLVNATSDEQTRRVLAGVLLAVSTLHLAGYIWQLGAGWRTPVALLVVDDQAGVTVR